MPLLSDVFSAALAGRAPPRLPGPAPRGLGLWLARQSRQDLPGLLQRLHDAHGPLCVTRVLHQRVADVFDPTLARALLVDHAAALQRWPRVPQVLARYHGARSLLVAEGDDWAALHAALVPALSPRTLAGLADAVVALAVPALDRALAEGARHAQGVDVGPVFARLTMQVIERVLFGTNRWTEAELGAAAAAIGRLGALMMREFFLPWEGLRRWPGARNQARRAGLGVLDGLLQPRLGEAPALQVLPPDARAANLRTLFAAGHDTTAQSLAWWCALMAHHPAALAPVQQELDSVLAGRLPTAADLGRLPGLTASLHEALRLYPAVPLLAMRRATAPIDLGAGWVLPTGTLVRIAPWMLHRDPAAWPQPLAFRPERFAPGAAAPVRGAWLPFGAGPRACIGRHMALMEMTAVAAVLLQRCTPRPLPGTVLPAPALDVVLRPRAPLRLALLPREAAVAGHAARPPPSPRALAPSVCPLRFSTQGAVMSYPFRFARAAAPIAVSLTLTLTTGLSLLPSIAAAQATPPPAELHLYRSFPMPAPGRWTEVALPLAPAGWRVGAPDGPAASAADLARWQAAPGLVVVAGRCRGAQSGATHYPCAFDLVPPAPPGASPGDGLAALMPWQTTSDDRMARYDRGEVQAASTARGGLGTEAAAALHGLLPDDASLLGFYAPAAALRGPGSTTLRLRGVDNPVQRGRFAPQGLLVLSTRPVPWPSPASSPALARSARAI